jgi:transcriptional regulator with XRE-family HTH domain
MKQTGEAPIERADDHKTGCDYIQVFHGLNSSFPSCLASSASHNLILKKICFIVKNTEKMCFLCGKSDAASSIHTKTILKMANETITTGLKKYEIGSKLRRLRLRKSMGLLELSKHTGLSPALLSKLERGLMHPTLPTLLRIAMVFSVGLEHFFHPEPQPVLEIVRKKDRLRFPESQDAAEVSYYFESLDFPVPDRAFNSYFAEFKPLKEVDSHFHQHPGIEFLYVLSGSLELCTGTERHELAEGDAVYFDCTVPHAYRRRGSKRTTAIVVALDAPGKGRTTATARF